jgi:ketosteroid isomerase-like protein
MSQRSDQDDRLAVERVRDEWTRAVAARDPEALRDFLTDDYEVWANGAQPIRGADGAIAAMRHALDRFNVVQRFDPLETIICGEWAFERGIESMTVTPIGGGPTRNASQRAFLILRRDASGRWRYARGMTNGLPTE